MPRKQRIPKILVTKEKTESFFQAIKNSIQSIPIEDREFLHLYDHKKQAIAISFTVDGHPFIGCSNGFNHTENRTLIEDSDWLLTQIYALLSCQPGEKRGGRIFFTSKGAFRAPGEQYLCYWDWQGDDIARRCVLAMFGK